jgi:hypothetical protein
MNQEIIDKAIQEVFNENNQINFELNTKIKEMVYIAGPYAGNTLENTQRACYVGKIATDYGLASFVPHPCIFMNVYGKDEIIEERQNGIISTLSIVGHICGLHNSHLWVIKNDDGSFSKGTYQEIQIWKKIKSDLNLPLNIKINTYSEWLKLQIN